MMKNRHSVALKWTLGVFLVLFVPISYRYILEKRIEFSGSMEFGEVKPFVFHDANGGSITDVSIYRSMTVVLNLPSTCTSESCESAYSQAVEAAQWIKSQLSVGYTEENNPLNLLISGGSSIQIDGWKRVIEVPEPGTLIPSKKSSDEPLLVVIDPWGRFAAVWSLNSKIDFSQMKRILSRTSFEQYLGNYLARRTFMGPKRE